MPPHGKILKKGPDLAASLFRATFAPLQHFERFETDSLKDIGNKKLV
jgi:hypothetical protein